MRLRLVSLLVCPDCHASLYLKPTHQQDDQILAGTLECSGCEKRYRIQEGIPRFVNAESYATSFSFEWKRWRRTQLAAEVEREAESTFLASTGWHPQQLSRKRVLDAGCGAGRYTQLLAKAGAEVVAIDLSRAVEVAQENLECYPNCHFLQADLHRLPLRAESFDFVFSIGVLHHTPDTHTAFTQLVRLVRPGGEIAVWVYPRRRLSETFSYFPDQVNEVLARDVSFRIPRWLTGCVRRFARSLDWIKETSSTIERALTTRLPPRWLYALCHLAIPLYYLYRIPLFYPLRLVSKVAMHPDPEWRVLDTFDWYSPRYQWKHTYEEVRAWYEEAGLHRIQFLPRPVALRGQKPE